MKYDFTSYSKTREDSIKWSMMKKQRPDVPDGVVPLTVADMEFKIQPELVEWISNYMKTANFGYFKPKESYYKAVMKFLEDRHGLTLSREMILTSPGIVTALHKAVRQLTNEGDNVIIFTPVYYPFYGAIRDENRNILETALIRDEKNHYTIDFDDFEEKAKDAKMIILCNPHNPLGRVWTHDELVKIADVCERNNLIICSDDIHLDFVNKRLNAKHEFIAKVSDYAWNNSITCTAPSKSFNLAGLEGSNIIIPDPALRERFGRVGAGISPFACEACECVYTNCLDWLDECLEVIYDNYDYCVEFFNKNIPEAIVTPLEGTYLMWVDFRFLGVDDSVLKEKLMDNNVFLDGGYMFGEAGNGFERFTLCVPKEVIKITLERVLETVNELRKDK